MKLVYFVSPYDLLNKRTRSPHPMTVEGMCCSCIEWHLATHILFCSKKKRIGCKSSLFMQILLWQMSVIWNFVFVVKKQCLENSWLWKLLGEKCQYLGEILNKGKSYTWFELSVLEKSQMKTFRTQLWKSVVSIWEILEWKLGMMIII